MTAQGGEGSAEDVTREEHRPEERSEAEEEEEEDAVGVLSLLLEQAPSVFDLEVLPRLSRVDRAVLGRVNRASREAVAGENGRVGPLIVDEFCGSISRLAWAKENGCPLDERVVCALARRGEVKILQWLWESHDHRDGVPWKNHMMRANACAAAAGGGHLDALRWLVVDRECCWDETTAMAAARGGHLHVLRWCQSRQCPWDDGTCAAAASPGKVHVLEFLRQHGCPWGPACLLPAARAGHVDVLQWAWERDCPVDARLAVSAAREGRLEVLKWARERGCVKPEDMPDVSIAAARSGHMHVLEWCRSHGGRWSAMACAW